MRKSFRRSLPAAAALATTAALGIGAFTTAASASPRPATPSQTAVSAATAKPASPFARCNSWALLGWKPGNRIYGGGWMTCFRPIPNFGQMVDVTLYRNSTPVAYNRQDCFGTGDHYVCSVNSPAVKNPNGYQNWCAVSTAVYGGFNKGGLYKKTSRECWRG